MLTIASQMNPIVCRVEMRKFVLVGLFTKPSRVSINSGHWPCGSSTAAIADTAWEAKFPALTFGDPRVMSASCLILCLVSLGRLSHRLAKSVWRLASCGNRAHVSGRKGRNGVREDVKDVLWQ